MDFHDNDASTAWREARELVARNRRIAWGQTLVSLAGALLCGVWVALNRSTTWRLIWLGLALASVAVAAARLSMAVSRRSSPPLWFRVFWFLHPGRLFKRLWVPVPSGSSQKRVDLDTMVRTKGGGMPAMSDEATAEEALARAAVTNRRWVTFQTLFFAAVLAVLLAQPWAPPGPPAGGDPDGVLVQAVQSELDEVLYGVPVGVRETNGAGVIQCGDIKESRGWSETSASALFTYERSVVDAIASNAAREGFLEVTSQGGGSTTRAWTKDVAGRPTRLTVFENPNFVGGGRVVLSMPTPQPPGYRSTC